MRPPVTLVLVLHGHIPDVLGHGTWPHGANWLYEAAAETYQPFLIAVERLLAAGIPVKATLGMTPVRRVPEVAATVVIADIATAIAPQRIHASWRRRKLVGATEMM